MAMAPAPPSPNEGLPDSEDPRRGSLSTQHGEKSNLRGKTSARKVVAGTFYSGEHASHFAATHLWVTAMSMPSTEPTSSVMPPGWMDWPAAGQTP